MHTGLAEALSRERCAHSVTLSQQSAQAPYDLCLPSTRCLVPCTGNSWELPVPSYFSRIQEEDDYQLQSFSDILLFFSRTPLYKALLSAAQGHLHLHLPDSRVKTFNLCLPKTQLLNIRHLLYGRALILESAMAARSHGVGFLLLSIRMCLKKTWLDFLAHVGRHRSLWRAQTFPCHRVAVLGRHAANIRASDAYLFAIPYFASSLLFENAEKGK